MSRCMQSRNCEWRILIRRGSEDGRNFDNRNLLMLQLFIYNTQRLGVVQLRRRPLKNKSKYLHNEFHMKIYMRYLAFRIKPGLSQTAHKKRDICTSKNF